MTYESIIKIFSKYAITSLDQLEEQLEYYLNAIDPHFDDCGDDPLAEDKDCTNANCYEEFFVPDCRKLIEIYSKYFKKEIGNRKLFIEYLVQQTSKKQSSIENYLYCRSCNQQIRKGTQASLKISDSEFKKDFCNNLNIKFSYTSLFETDYTSVKQFLNKEHRVTSDTYVPQYKQSESIMTKDEEKKLFNISHTSKSVFQNNLKNKENLQGSFSYLLNLALNAFDRNLVSESKNILTIIAKFHSTSCATKEYLQLKAKIHSYCKEDKEAIDVLNELIQNNQPNLDSESYNLLAASIKREAMDEFFKYSDEQKLSDKLVKAKNLYYTVYHLTNNYYPALNYIYLMKILSYIHQDDKKQLLENVTKIWESIELKINDWWSFIANIEFLLISEKYDEAFSTLESHYSDVKNLDINEFNLYSTIRQLDFYAHFCDDSEIKQFIDKIKTLET